MAIIHITEAEAARDLPALLAKVRAGEEVRIGNESESFLITRIRGAIEELPRRLSGDLKDDASTPRSRTLSEAIRLSEARGSNITLDNQFGKDLEEIIRSREHERLGDRWESF